MEIKVIPKPKDLFKYYKLGILVLTLRFPYGWVLSIIGLVFLVIGLSYETLEIPWVAMVG
jgi:hypothetical protein